MRSLTARFYDEVFIPYLGLLKAEYRFHPTFTYAKQIWEEKLTVPELVNGPYLEKTQSYASEPVDNLPLHPKTLATIRKKLGERDLYTHQAEALKLVL